MKVIITSQSGADGHWKTGDLFSYGSDGLFMVNRLVGDSIRATVIVPRNHPDCSPAGDDATFDDVARLRKVTQLNVTTV